MYGKSRPRALPRLHVVTDDDVLADPDFDAGARAVVQSLGPDVALHLRGPRTSVRRLLKTADALADAMRRSGSVLIVNDRVDVALAVGADGVQLGERSLSPADARRVWGSRPWIGASVHDVERARRCVDAGAHYVVAGSIYETPSHPGRAGAGPAWVRRVVTAVDVPVIAIGGVDPARVPDVVAAGAYGVAALGAVWRHPQGPGAGARALIESLNIQGEEAVTDPDGPITIEVRLNGGPREVPAGLSVNELLLHLDLRPGMVVVEKNREILSRDDFDNTPVEEGDQLELVHFVGGG